MTKKRRQLVPPEQRREHITLRLPKHLVDWIESQGTRAQVIEAAVRKLKEHREQHHSV